MRTILILWISLACSLAFGQSQTANHFSYTRTTTLNYLIFTPKGYAAQDSKFPLLIFLHGSGERGDDLNLVKKWGPPSFVDQQPDFPFITLSPQCPAEVWWNVDDLQALLEHIIKEYRVDTTRIYLTGLSMGGFGTWAWACRYPHEFAAIAPVCGGGDLQFADELIHTPVWAFHGQDDPVVPAQRSTDMVYEVNRNGGNARLTLYPGVGHDSWIPTYQSKELYDWLLQNHK